MPFYLLVCLLYTEAQSMEHVVRLLSQGHVLRHTSKCYTAMNGRVMTLGGSMSADRRQLFCSFATTSNNSVAWAALYIL